MSHVQLWTRISTGRIEELITELKQDYTVVIVTHNMQQAARCSDHTAFMYLASRSSSATRTIRSPSPRRNKQKTISPVVTVNSGVRNGQSEP